MTDLSPEEKLAESVLEFMVEKGSDHVAVHELRKHLRYFATYTFVFWNLATLAVSLAEAGFIVVLDGHTSVVTEGSA